MIPKGTDLLSLMLFIHLKHIEYKKMKQFCISKFEIRKPKEKREECSFCLCFIATMREAHVFLVDFYENLAYTKLCNDFIFYMFMFSCILEK